MLHSKMVLSGVTVANYSADRVDPVQRTSTQRRRRWRRRFRLRRYRIVGRATALRLRRRQRGPRHPRSASATAERQPLARSKPMSFDGPIESYGDFFCFESQTGCQALQTVTARHLKGPQWGRFHAAKGFCRDWDLGYGCLSPF